MLLSVRLRIDLFAISGTDDANPQYAILSVSVGYDEVQLSKLVYFQGLYLRHPARLPTIDQSAFSQRVFGHLVCLRQLSFTLRW